MTNHDMTNIELQYYNMIMANMESIAKSLKELDEVVKSIQNSAVKVLGDIESKQTVSKQ